MKVVFDSVILIDQLNSVSDAAKFIKKHEGYISGMSIIEVLAGAKSDKEEQLLWRFLQGFKIIHTNSDICQNAAVLRRILKLKAADAIIYATAKHLGCKLVTRNSNDFSESWGDVVIPYRV